MSEISTTDNGSSADAGWTIDAPQSSWETPEEGVSEAVVEEVGQPFEEEDKFSDSGKMKKKFYIRFGLLDQTGSDGGQLSISRKYTASMFKRSNLFKDVTAIYGRALTADELKSFRPSTLEGEQCRVLIEHTPRANGDGVWANVAKVMKAAA